MSERPTLDEIARARALADSDFLSESTGGVGGGYVPPVDRDLVVVPAGSRPAGRTVVTTADGGFETSSVSPGSGDGTDATARASAAAAQSTADAALTTTVASNPTQPLHAASPGSVIAPVIAPPAFGSAAPAPTCSPASTAALSSDASCRARGRRAGRARHAQRDRGASTRSPGEASRKRTWPRRSQRS